MDSTCHTDGLGSPRGFHMLVTCLQLPVTTSGHDFRCESVPPRCAGIRIFQERTDTGVTRPSVLEKGRKSSCNEDEAPP